MPTVTFGPAVECDTLATVLAPLAGREPGMGWAIILNHEVVIVAAISKDGIEHAPFDAETVAGNLEGVTTCTPWIECDTIEVF